jgi:hypothetical protein
MATITKGRTFVSGEVVTPTKVNTLVDSATVTNIVNADVSASAAIADTKLATIATAGKVANSATTATNANTASTIVARDASGNFSAGTVTANLTGNASTATALQTARTIAISGDVTGTATSFNGGANITIASAITADSIVNADINSAAAISATKLEFFPVQQGGGTGQSNNKVYIGWNGSQLQTQVDAANFGATWPIGVSGNASTATSLQTARTIAISGDVTGTATSFNGTAAITIASAITADSIVNADINSAAAIADTKLATIATAGKVANSATTATAANTANAIVARDASGNFSAGAITASGNVSVGGNLIPTWKIRTAAYTALSGDMVGANTVAGSWTLTLPASPTAGMMVTILDAGGVWFTRPLTVARNGSTIDNLAEDLICDVSDKIVVLLFNGTTWSINQ